LVKKQNEIFYEKYESVSKRKIKPQYRGDGLKDLQLLTGRRELVMVSDISDGTQVFCPVCEGSHSTTPSATVYKDCEGWRVICHKDKSHNRWSGMNKNYMEEGGFKDESRI
jgi:hypothetical protein